MSKNIIKYVVIFLGILIIFSFIALIYGMYLKISTNSKILTLDQKNFSLNLGKDEQIIDIEVIDENNLLIKIDNSTSIKGAIYNIKENRILNFIEE